MTSAKDIKIVKVDLATNIARLREKQGHSLNILSDKTELGIGVIKKIETGIFNPSLRDITKISVALDTPIHFLLSTDSSKD